MSDWYRAFVRRRLPPWAPPVVCCIVLTTLLSGRSAAQLFMKTSVELSDAIRVDEPAPMVRNALERVRVNIAQSQWDEAIEGLRGLMETHGDRLVRLDSRFISLRELGNMELVKLPAEGLALYRGRVDSQAERWYQEGMKNRDAVGLERVVDTLFASSFGDDALFALGEIYLERGLYQRARETWERISPVLRSADGLPLWIEARTPNSAASKNAPAAQEPAQSSAAAVTWLAYPDTNLKLADVRARLVLASLLEGSRQRAAVEYRTFSKLHPDEVGRLAGRQGVYREILSALLTAADEWPAPSTVGTATTFAGDSTRNWIAPGDFAVRSLAWVEPIAFSKKWQAHKDTSIRFGLPDKRVAESAQDLLGYHPLVVNDLVVFHDLHRVYVFDLKTGRPAWGSADTNSLPGQVYPRGAVHDLDSARGHVHALGVPRFTTTVHGSYLFVRLGSQVTSWPETSPTENRGSLVVLDLAQQGKLIAELKPESERWSFEGPPVCDGSRFYVAMRYNDVRPQSHVACYELVATTGFSGTTYTPRLRWRRMVCSAESPTHGSAEEITHNQLTLAEDALYLNTNLGAVARLSTDDGRIVWLSTYPRAQGDADTDHFFRDLNPCLYHRGTIYVVPTDAPQVFALDAMTGLVRWATPPGPMADVVHLLGVAQRSLIASGRNLWWFDAETGKFIASYPEPHHSGQVQPFGRGLLVGDAVVWPTRQELHVFQQRQSPSVDANQKPATRREPIRLANYAPGLSGGNVVTAGDYLLLATPDKLWAFGPKLHETFAKGPR